MGPALPFVILLGLSVSAVAAEDPDQLLEFTRDSCRGWEASKAPAAGYARDGISEAPITFGAVTPLRKITMPSSAINANEP